MPKFRVDALSEQGAAVTETAEAESAESLRREIAARGWEVLSVQAVADATSAADGPALRLSGPGGRLSSGDLITLGEELAGMARAGLPLDQALGSLAREMGRSRLKTAVVRLSDDLRAGRTLPEALAAQHGAIPEIYAALVEAGLRTGRLPDVMATVTLYSRTVADVRSLVWSAALYPTLVFVFGATMFIAMASFILPQFEALFDDFGTELPRMTRVALVVGRHPLLCLAPFAAILAAVALTWLMLRWTPRGRQRLARLLYSLPLLGSLVRGLRLAAFADLLGILIDQQVPLVEAVRLAGAASTDALVAAGSRSVECELREGKTLAAAFRAQPLIPDFLTWMVATGEPRGALAPSLRQAADVYRRRAELRVGFLRSVLPSFLIVVVGLGLVTFFTMAMFMPLIKLMTALSL